MKIASIVGARPNFIKCAPLSKELRKEFDEVLIHTGQHYDYEMNKVFFDELNIPEPDYHLGVGSGSHGYQLRSYDRRMPEETNRVLTDHCSDLLFCPTETAVKILGTEGIEDGVYLTGDVMVDALQENIKIAEQKSNVLDLLSLKPKEYYLATVHRAESTDEFIRLKSIVEAFCVIGDIVFPCHPRTEKLLKQFGLWDMLTKKVKVIKPVGYLDMLILEKNAKKILTDSGGIQKEASILKVPCITLRENTEWVETVADGWNVLVGANKETVIKAVREFKPSLNNYRERFGDGRASEKITDALKSFGY
jgi:UDP-N-acetylglucosamine 2-epimerase (non-hydrolysing)